MAILPIFGSRPGLSHAIVKMIEKRDGPYESAVVLGSNTQAMEFLTSEMPEVLLIDFGGRRLDGLGLVRDIQKDPWLIHGGIIAICDDREAKERLEKLRGPNIIVILTRDEVADNLSKILHILETNHRILFQREIETDLLAAISGEFCMSSDLIEVSCYINLICNFLYNTNRLDVKGKISLWVSLSELIVNAIEHGNCGITYEEKSAWLGAGGNIFDLIRQKCVDPIVYGRRVTLEYALNSESARFCISDEGAGFDWKRLSDPTLPENALALHGRGIFVTRAMTQNLSFNSLGNSVSFELTYPPKETALTPALFNNIAPEAIPSGATVFKEGDPGDYIYYIVKGEFDVIVQGTKISSLVPDDIFMGEMSFLLDNRRSATVIARTPGKLIRLSKKQFINAVRKKPHYALLLARLLAQRIHRGNQKSMQ